VDGGGAISGTPSGYSNTGTNTGSGVSQGYGEIESAAASETPGAFTKASGEEARGYIIAVRPAPPPNDIGTAAFEAGSASMAIPGAGGSASVLTSGSSSLITTADPSQSITLSAGNGNRALVVGVVMEHDFGALFEVTFGGQSLSVVTDGTTNAQLDDASGAASVQFHILREADMPSDGSQSIVLDTSGAATNGMAFAWWLLDGVAQDANVVDVTIATSTGTPLSADVTASAAGDIVFAASYANDVASQGSTLTIAGGAVTDMDVDGSSAGGWFGKAGDAVASGAGTVAVSSASSGVNRNVVAAFVLGTSGGGGGSAIQLQSSRSVSTAAFEAGAASFSADMDAESGTNEASVAAFASGAASASAAVTNFKTAPALADLIWWRGSDLSDGAVASWPDTIQGVDPANATGTQQPSASSGIVEFDGTADRLVHNAANPYSGSLTQIYIAGWLDGDGSLGSALAISRGGGATSATRISIGYVNSLGYFVSAGNGAAAVSYLMSSPAQTGWHFLELWYDGSQSADDRLQRAIDGSALGVSGTYLNTNRMPSSLDASDVWTLGCLDGAGTASNFWPGTIANLYVSSERPSDSQRAALRALEPPIELGEDIEQAAFASGAASMAAALLASRSVGTAAFSAGAASMAADALASRSASVAAFASGAAAFSVDLQRLDEVIEVAAFQAGAASFSADLLASSSVSVAAFASGAAALDAGTLARSKPVSAAAFASGPAALEANGTLTDLAVLGAAFQAGAASFAADLGRSKPLGTAAFQAGAASLETSLLLKLGLPVAAFASGAASFSSDALVSRSVSLAAFASGAASFSAEATLTDEVVRVALFSAGSASMAATLFNPNPTIPRPGVWVTVAGPRGALGIASPVGAAGALGAHGGTDSKHPSGAVSVRRARGRVH
jgi:hypothetical protein